MAGVDIQANATTDPTVSLNGAQVASIVTVVNQVVQGQLPRESAVKILEIAFALAPKDADAMMGSVGKSFKPENEDMNNTSVAAKGSANVKKEKEAATGI
jgi:hypothetical protein